jgi:uncharacterized protein (TIGR00369 family)
MFFIMAQESTALAVRSSPPWEQMREVRTSGRNCSNPLYQAYQWQQETRGASPMTDFEARDLTEGLNGELGFRLRDWSEGFAQISVDLDHRHKNRQGGLHGGTTSTLIDAATGFCGVYEPDPEKRRGNVTVSLTVNFVGRAKTSTIICTAKTVKTGRRLYFAAAEVHDDDGNLVATADAVYAYVDRDAQRQKSGS